MEILKRMIVDKFFENAPITEQYKFDMNVPSGVLSFSDLYCCFGKSYSTLNYKFPSTIKVYAGFRYLQDDDYTQLVYVRFELNEGEIDNFIPLGIDGYPIDNLEDWDAYESQIGGENYTGFCDKFCMENINNFITEKWSSDYIKVVDQLEKFDVERSNDCMKLNFGTEETEFATFYSPNAEATAFLAKSSFGSDLSIIIDFGALVNRL